MGESGGPHADGMPIRLGKRKVAEIWPQLFDEGEPMFDVVRGLSAPLGLRSDAEESALSVTRLDDEVEFGAERQDARGCGFPLGRGFIVVDGDSYYLAAVVVRSKDVVCLPSRGIGSGCGQRVQDLHDAFFGAAARLDNGQSDKRHDTFLRHSL